MKKNLIYEMVLEIHKDKNLIIENWVKPREFKPGYSGIVDGDAGVEIGKNGELIGARTQTKHSECTSRNAYTDKAEKRGTIPVPFKELPPSMKRKAEAMKEWLRVNGWLKKMSKEDFSTIDLKFVGANGECLVSPEGQKSFRVPLEKYMPASVVAEEEDKIENLGIEFGTEKGAGGQAKSIIKSVIIKNGKKQVYDWNNPDLPDFYRSAVKRVASAIRKHDSTTQDPNKKIMAKINPKEDWKTVDVRLMGNGDAIVNFDDGGTVRVTGAAASMYTEEVNYFPY